MHAPETAPRFPAAEAAGTRANYRVPPRPAAQSHVNAAGESAGTKRGTRTSSVARSAAPEGSPGASADPRAWLPRPATTPATERRVEVRTAASFDPVPQPAQ